MGHLAHEQPERIPAAGMLGLLAQHGGEFGLAQLGPVRLALSARAGQCRRDHHPWPGESDSERHGDAVSDQVQPPDADVRGEPTQAGGHRDFTVPEVAAAPTLKSPGAEQGANVIAVRLATRPSSASAPAASGCRTRTATPWARTSSRSAMAGQQLARLIITPVSAPSASRVASARGPSGVCACQSS